MPPTVITTDDELQVLLGTLGTSPEQVAETLRAKGIKGQPMQAHSCPIAKWLSAETGAAVVTVDTGSCGVYLGFGPGRESVQATPPGAVDQFIVQFDDREYPDLVAED
jgi:hypothetical protein